MMLDDIREGRAQRKKARNVLSRLSIPQAVHYLARDEINRPHKKRAARWAAYGRRKKGWIL